MALRTVVQRALQSASSGHITSALAVKNNAREYGKFLNSVQLLGRVGREPYRVGDSEITVFPLFTEHSFKTQDGEQKTFPCWHRVVVMRKGLSEIVQNQVDRGQRVFINGRLAYRQVPGTEGVSEQRAFIVAEEVIMLEKSRKQQGLRNDGFDELPPESEVEQQKSAQL